MKCVTPSVILLIKGLATFSTMVGGILADVWITAERNTPMVLFTGATLLGTGKSSPDHSLVFL